MGTRSPALGGEPDCITIRCSPPGFSSTAAFAGTVSSGTARMRLTPSTTEVLCSDTSANVVLAAAVMTTGVRQGFSIRAKPASIGT